jgi:NAD(P)-dependent dehydrogenase (short-subunit alcohol dehydrogenase family)
MQLIDLNNRKIFVTGASSGIGRSVCILLSRLGANVILCGRDLQRLNETKGMMDHAEQHRVFSFDVKDYEGYAEVFNSAVSDGVKLDGMVHCAGIAKVTPLRIMKHSDIMELLEVNYVSFMELTKLYAKKKYSTGGSVVAISAANCHYPQKCMSVYAASKAALESSVKCMALELAAQHIRINCVVPGAIDTPMMQDVQEEEQQKILKNALLGAGRPEDVANMVAFLLSDASAFITGRSMYVDGGMLGQQN